MPKKTQKTLSGSSLPLAQLAGPAYIDHTLCHDSIDVVSRQSIWFEDPVTKKRVFSDEIEVLFSYTDSRGFVRGFAVESIQALIKAASDEGSESVLHPISRLPIASEDIQRAKDLIEMLGLPDMGNQYQEDFACLPPHKLSRNKMEKFCLQVFQFLTLHNLHLNENEFMSLGVNGLVRFCTEMAEMFVVNLPENYRKLVAPPRGLAFDKIPLSEEKNILRQFVLSEIHGIFKISRKLAPEYHCMTALFSYVVVGALATVCTNIRKQFESGIIHDFEISENLIDEDETFAFSGQEEEEASSSSSSESSDDSSSDMD